MRSTHTYVTLDVSQPTYDEIAGKLRLAGYGHAFNEQGGEIVIDMHGLALVRESQIVKEAREATSG